MTFSGIMSRSLRQETAARAVQVMQRSIMRIFGLISFL